MMDPIADFIVRIKNAGATGKESISVPYSKLKMEIAKVLAKEGYIESAEKQGRKIRKSIVVGIKYDSEQNPRVQNVRRISKPSRRMYMSAHEIRPMRQGYSTLILSTPKGVLTGEAAKKVNVGGEALFEIW